MGGGNGRTGTGGTPAEGALSAEAVRVARVERLSRISLFAALALVLSYLETMIPLPVAVPGIKLGLANAAVLVALFTMDVPSAFGIALVKVLAAGLLFGSPMMIAYSAGGTLLAFAGMLACRKVRGLGLVPTSMVAAILHNAGQLLVASLMLGTAAVFATLPLLAAAACITGALIGAVAQGVLGALAPREGEARSNVDASALRIEPGQRIAFVGANGSGKTTCALQLAGLLPGNGTESGAARLVQGEGLRAGIVFQDPDDQMVGLTVRDDVAFGLENRGIDVERMRTEIDSALGRLGIGGLAQREVSSLSGGQKQKVAIAGVLVATPQMVVFDEATSMLDGKARQAFEDLVGELAGRGLVVVQITQIMDEAFAADSIVVFAYGRIVWQGSPEALLAREGDLAGWGLALPSVARIAHDLREQGVQVPLTNDIGQLEETLWRLCARA